MLKSDKLWLWLIPALLLIFAVGAYNLNLDVIWRDELTTIFHVGGVRQEFPTLAGVLNTLETYSRAHMPGYFLFMAGWARLVGWSPFALRAMSLFFGLLAVCCTYRLARTWLSPRAGLYAALVMGLNTFFIYYTHELRMYTMLVFFAAFTLWQYRRIITAAAMPRLPVWVLFWFGAVGTLGTHVYGGLTLAAVGLLHMLKFSRTKRWLLVWLALAGAGVIFLPWLPVIVPRADQISSEDLLAGQALNPVEIAGLASHLFTNGLDVLLVIVLASAVYALRGAGRRVREVWLVAAGVFVLTLAANQIASIVTLRRARYLIHLWPLLALLVGLGLVTIDRLVRRRVSVIIVMVWVGFGIANAFNPAFLAWMDGPLQATLPLNRIFPAVEKLVYRDEMYFLVSRPNALFERGKVGISSARFYLRDHASHINYMEIQAVGDRTPDALRQEIVTQAGDRMRVWLVYEPNAPADILSLTRSALAVRYELCGTDYEEAGFRIDRYDLAQFGCLPTRADSPPLASFEPDIWLHGVRLYPMQDNRITVLTAWEVGDSVPPETYSVSLKVWNGGDSHVALADFGLRYPGFGWQRAVIDTHHLLPDQYELTLTVYDWKTGEQRTGRSGETIGFTLPLLTFDLPLQTSAAYLPDGNH